jgi:signal transduction histidine kinase
MKARGRKLAKKAARRPAARNALRRARKAAAPETAALRRDLAEALEQQTATSEVLQVIASSSGELEPVFQAMLRNATRICDANFASLFDFRNGAPRVMSTLNLPAAVAEFLRGSPPRPTPLNAFSRMRESRKPMHIADYSLDQAYLGGDPMAVAGVELGGIRSLLIVPMAKDDEIIGAFGIFRQEVRPFTDKQIELVQSFAAQAVIAIENTRLLKELRQRTDDLTESLEQQTATGEILASISGSLTDTKPVFEAIVRNLLRLFGTRFAVVQLLRDNMIEMAAVGGDPGFEKMMTQYPRPLDKTTGGGLAMLTKQVQQFSPIRGNPETPPVMRRFADEHGFDATIFAPMIRGESVVGVIGVAHHEAKVFDEKQIDLIRSFADQAVIAIENARLFDELQKRTEDLSESLQQQTATADVLKVISRSAFDLQTVLDTLLRSAGRLCDAEMGAITQRKADQFYRAVTFGLPPKFLEQVRDEAVELNRNSGSGRALLEGKIIHIEDIEADQEYTWSPARDLGGFHTLLGVPMLRDGAPVGVLTLMRNQVRPFTEKEIALVSTFADQAAIAIENVRLFDEIQEKSHQLEEASAHKSRFLANMSHELRTPLNAILGYTELIQDAVYGEPPEKMKTVLERISRNGKHLLGLINDVLDLSKIEAGQLVLTLDDYSIRDVVHGVYGAVENLAASKKLAFKIDMPKDLPPGRGDERRLTQVLLNLVGNAIKFTDQGEITIKASAENGDYTLAVRDTGPGISEADQQKLFQEFQQADNSITKAKGGTGLGLAISKRIIEMHGGRIWVDSAPGQGSTFSLTLPIKVEQARQP